MLDFHGKVALVTGAANGIGAATARLLKQRGATVVSTDVTMPSEAHTSDEFLALDVTDEDGWKAIVDATCSRYAGLHILVNAAGIVGNVVDGNLERTSLQEWRRVMGVNLDGTFLGCREAMRVMKRQRAGAIVNVASLAAYYPTLYSVAYGASKGAVTQLTKSVALSGTEDGARVRCNSVHPGVISTQLFDSIGQQMRERNPGANTPSSYASRVPLGEIGSVTDAAALIAFLASNDASYITGSEFTIDGGSHLLR